MDIEKLKTMSAEDRKLVLESEAIAVEEGKYEKPLAPEELSFFKDEVAENSIKQAVILDELSDIKKKFKADLEPIAINIKTALRNIKHKSMEKDGRLYKIADFDDQMIHKVDEFGNVISSRKMLPEERQFRIQALKQQSA
jgi:hypothetical protein